MTKYSDFEKIPQDQYFTPEKAVTPLGPFLEPNTTFYEPCAGDGRLVAHLENLGMGLACTGYSDLDPTSARMTADDFFNGAIYNDVVKKDALEVTLADLNGADSIITNPPWTRTKASGYLLHKMIVHFSDMVPTWLLFDASWANTGQAAPYMDRCTDIVAIGRVKWFPNTTQSGKKDACWYRFSKPSLRTTTAPLWHGKGLLPS
jgi:hypothetical protein